MTSVMVVLGLMAVSFLVFSPIWAGSQTVRTRLVVTPAIYGIAAFCLAQPIYGAMVAAAAGLAMCLQDAAGAFARTSAPGRDAGARLLGSLTGHALAVVPVAGALLVATLLPEGHAAFGLLWLFAGALSALCLMALLPLWPLDGGRCLTLILDACTPTQAAVVTLTAPLVFMSFALHYQSLGGVALVVGGAILALAMRDRNARPVSARAASLAIFTWQTTAAAHATAMMIVLSVY